MKDIKSLFIFEIIEQKWYSPKKWVKYLQREYKTASTSLKGRSNFWMIGKSPPTKGKTYSEYFGEERAKEIKNKIGTKSSQIQREMSEEQRLHKSEKISKAQKGKPKVRSEEGMASYRKNRVGKPIHTEESKEKMRKSIQKCLDDCPELRQSRAHPGETNGMFGKTHTEESRAKISRSIKEKYATDSTYREKIRLAGAKGWHSQDKRKTTIEILTEEYLKSLGISFQYNYAYGFYCYDFFLEDMNIFIEVQGDYWHGNPTIFPILNEAQKKNQTRDRQKKAFAINKGFRVYYIWECNIRNNDFSELSEVVNEFQSRRSN